MSLNSHELYEFGKFRLNVNQRFLTSLTGERLPLSDKAFEILCILVRNSGNLVSKSELMDQVWADTFVEENNLDKCIFLIRRALKEKPGQLKFVETVRKHGYRFVANVRRIETEEAPAAHKEAAVGIESVQASFSTWPAEQTFHTPEAVFARSGWRPRRDETEIEANESDPETEYSGSELLSTSPDSAAEKRRGVLANWLAAPALVLTIVLPAILFGFWSFQREVGKTEGLLLGVAFSTEILSTNGQVVHAIISADGENVIYTNGKKGKQSVWLRKLNSGNNVEIIPPGAYVYGGLAFSPDGNSFYFARRPQNIDGQLDLYRSSVFGGTATRIVHSAQGWIGISPDGGKISFVRCYYLEEENCSLWVANSDGGGEKKLASRQRPFRIGDNKISPDGKTVAFAVGQSEDGGNEFSVVGVNIETGAETALTSERFFNIKTLEWLPEQSGLLLTASKTPNKNFCLWQLSLSSGEAIPVKRNGENYSSVRLSGSSGLMAAVQVKTEMNLTVFGRGNPADKRVLADATTVGFAPNGRIVYSSPMSGSDEIWSVNPDGSGQKQLTQDPSDDSVPLASPGGTAIFFVSNRTGNIQIWRMNADGSDQMQITAKEGGWPLFVSPDGNWLYYQHKIKKTLWRVSAKGQGGETQFLEQKGNRFAFSPDGSHIAFSESDGPQLSIRILAAGDGRIVKTIKKGDLYSPREFGLVWMADGKSLAFITAEKEFGSHTLWLQRIDTEIPQKIAELGDDTINSFAVSADERSFAIVQGGWKHNAVLLRNSR